MNAKKMKCLEIEKKNILGNLNFDLASTLGKVNLFV